MRRKSLPVLMAIPLVLSLFLMAGSAFASPDGRVGGQIIFGRDFRLRSGEVLSGAVVVFGGNVILEEGSQAFGDLVVFGGDISVAGRLNGNITAIGGDVRLAGTAIVEGEVTTLGGTVRRTAGAQLRGKMSGWPWESERWERLFPIRPVAPQPWGWWFFWRIFRVVGQTLVLAVLGGILAAFWPVQAGRVGRTCIVVPGPSLGVGVLTIVVGAIAVVLLAVTICLSPLAILGAIALGLATLYGWLAVGFLVGERVLAGAMSTKPAPFWVGALGAGLITLAAGLLDTIPCIGWLGGFLIASWGLGAVVLTRLGALEYPPTASTPTSP